MARARSGPSRFRRRSSRRRCPTCRLTKRLRRVSPSSPTRRARPSPCRRSCWRRTAPRGTRSPPRRCPSPLRSRRPPSRTPRWAFPRRAPSPPPSASPPPPPPPSARLGSSARSPPAPASSGRRSSSTEVDTPPPPPRPSRAPRAQHRSRSSAPLGRAPLRQRRPTRRRPTTSRRPRCSRASCRRRAGRPSCPRGAEASSRGMRLRQLRARRCPRASQEACIRMGHICPLFASVLRRDFEIIVSCVVERGSCVRCSCAVGRSTQLFRVVTCRCVFVCVNVCSL
mmetsp:Transcript_45565/g.109375  ORF Transcript_45565/g.109375 Transcript_45565/m.109375 type:complete len:283 (-) Transcript_45565:42-890(-)